MRTTLGVLPPTTTEKSINETNTTTLHDAINTNCNQLIKSESSTLLYNNSNNLTTNIILQSHDQISQNNFTSLKKNDLSESITIPNNSEIKQTNNSILFGNQKPSAWDVPHRLKRMNNQNK